MKSTPRPTRSAETRMDRMIQDLALRKTNRPLDSQERVLATRLRKWASDDQQETINGLLKKTTGENDDE